MKRSLLRSTVSIEAKNPTLCVRCVLDQGFYMTERSFLEWLFSKECSTIPICRVGGKVKRKRQAHGVEPAQFPHPRSCQRLIQNHKVSNNQQVMIESPMSNQIDDVHSSDCVRFIRFNPIGAPRGSRIEIRGNQRENQT